MTHPLLLTVILHWLGCFEESNKWW